MKKIGLLRLVAIGFCALCAGPFGLEELMQFGAKTAIYGLVLAAILWGVPTGLMSAELGSNIPETGGPVAWILYSFGKRTGAFFGYITMASALFDLALYPIMFGAAASATFPSLDGLGWQLGIGMIVCSVILNLLGIVRAGDGSIIFSTIIMAPFVLALSGVKSGEQIIPDAVIHTEKNIWTAVLTSMWAFAGFDSFGSVAAEVENPQKNVPRAIILTALSMLCIGSIPIIIWAEGYGGSWEAGAGWVACGRALCGEDLATAIGISGMVSTWALFNAQLLTNTRIPGRLAIAGLLPKWCEPNRNGVPVVATVIFAMGAALLSDFGFIENLSIGVVLLGISVMLEFGALWFRKTKNRCEGSFEMPPTLMVFAPFPPLFLLCGAIWGIAGESIMVYGFAIPQLSIAGMAVVLCLLFARLSQRNKEELM